MIIIIFEQASLRFKLKIGFYSSVSNEFIENNEPKP